MRNVYLFFLNLAGQKSLIVRTRFFNLFRQQRCVPWRRHGRQNVALSLPFNHGRTCQRLEFPAITLQTLEPERRQRCARHELLLPPDSSIPVFRQDKR